MHKLTGSVALVEGTPEFDAVQRLSLACELSVGKSMKAAMQRYAQLMLFASVPNPVLVGGVQSIMQSFKKNEYDCAYYPSREALIDRIKSSMLPDDLQDSLRQYLMHCHFTDYARLIEAAENV